MGHKQTGKIALGIRDEHVNPGAHIAFLWDSEEQFLEALGFLQAGFHGHDSAVVFGYGEANAKVIEGLKRLGLDVEELERDGRLAEVGGQPTGEATLAAIGPLSRRWLTAAQDWSGCSGISAGVGRVGPTRMTSFASRRR